MSSYTANRDFFFFFALVSWYVYPNRTQWICMLYVWWTVLQLTWSVKTIKLWFDNINTDNKFLLARSSPVPNTVQIIFHEYGPLFLQAVPIFSPRHVWNIVTSLLQLNWCCLFFWFKLSCFFSLKGWLWHIQWERWTCQWPNGTVRRYERKNLEEEE